MKFQPGGILSDVCVGKVSSRSSPKTGLHCSSGNNVPSGSVIDLGGEYIAIQPLTTNCDGKGCVSKASSIRRGQVGQASLRADSRQKKIRHRIGCGTESLALASFVMRWCISPFFMNSSVNMVRSPSIGLHAS